jgi:hypothetical protein
MTRIRAIGDNILCTEADFGESITSGGIIIKDTIGTSDGVCPRWFHVDAIGPDINWIEVGQWVYVEYGRWTEGVTVGEDTVWKVEPAACMMVSDKKPDATNLASNAIDAPKKILE